MTQSAMSHLISGLEDELEVKLLLRDAKAIEPTPAGRLFYEHAKHILVNYRKLEDKLYSFTKKIKGPLMIGASPTAANYLLPQVLYDFAKEYPAVRIELSVSGFEKTVADLTAGKIDLAIKDGTISLLKISEEKLTRKFSMATMDKEPSTLTAYTFRDFIRAYKFFIPF